jgi:hypothetical protein
MIAYNRVTTGQTLQQVGQAIHAALIGAGWTIAYADTDAITGGTAGTPGWGKTAAINTIAGRATYQMPVTALATRWFVDIELYWNTAITMYSVAIKTATACSVAGVLTSPGTQVRPTPATAGNTGEFVYCASPNGFAVGIALSTGGAGYAICVERKRNLAGVALDDIMVHAIANGMTINGTSLTYGGGINRSLSGSENGAVEYIFLRKVILGTNAYNTSEPTSLAGAGALRGVPMGPLLASGGLGGMSEHILFFPATDAPLGNDLTVSFGGVDGVVGVAGTSTALGYRIAFRKS